MSYSWFQRLGMKIFGLKYFTETKYAIAEANNKKLAEKLASTQSELGLKNSEIERLKSEKNNSLNQQEIAKKLKEQEEDIRQEDLGKLFSLGAMYRAIYGVKIPEGASEFSRRSKFGKRFEFADKDDKNPFIFGDINISDKALFVITDKDKNIRGQYPLPPGMFAKPSSLLNQIRRNRLLLGTDANGRYIPEFDDVEINLPVWNDNLQEYEDAEVLRVNARKTIIELKDEIRALEDTSERHEIIIDAGKRDIRDLKRKNEKYQAEIKIYESDMSRINREYEEMKRNISKMQSRILELQEVAAMKEGLATKFENSLTEALAKIEDIAGKTAKEKAMGEFKDVFNFLQMQSKVSKSILPNMEEK